MVLCIFTFLYIFKKWQKRPRMEYHVTLMLKGRKEGVRWVTSSRNSKWNTPKWNKLVSSLKMGLIYYLYENIQVVQQFGVTRFCLKLLDKVSQAEIVRELEKRKSDKAGVKWGQHVVIWVNSVINSLLLLVAPIWWGHRTSRFS